MCGEGVSHPIQRIVPYFNLIQTLSFDEKIEYLAFWFLKKDLQTIHIYTHTKKKGGLMHLAALGENWFVTFLYI